VPERTTVNGERTEFVKAPDGGVSAFVYKGRTITRCISADGSEMRYQVALADGTRTFALLNDALRYIDALR
jgi:hypothetical protein